MPVTEVALRRCPVARILGAGPGQGTAGVDRGMRFIGAGSGAAVRLERDDVGQCGGAQGEVPIVAGGVGTASHHGPAGEARFLAAHSECGENLRFGTEVGIGPAAGKRWAGTRGRACNE